MQFKDIKKIPKAYNYTIFPFIQCVSSMHTFFPVHAYKDYIHFKSEAQHNTFDPHFVTVV